MIYEGERERPIRANLSPTPHCEALRDAIPGLSAMGAVILLSAAETDRARSYSRRNDHYAATPKRYRCNYTRRKVVKDGVNNLVDLGLLAEHDVRPAGTHNRGRQSTLRLNDDVRSLAYGITGRRFVVPPRELLVMKDTNKRLADFPEDRRTRIMRDELAEQNERVKAARIIGAEVSEAFRVFNNSSWDEGGRIYWPGQNQPKAERDDWMIDGEPTVEPDFVAIHPSLLYAERGMRFQADEAYNIAGHDPRLVKIGLLVMINARTEAAATTRIVVEIENRARKAVGAAEMRRGEEIPSWRLTAARALMDAIKKRHAPIAGSFNTGAGTRLQAIDARIALAVMTLLGRCGITVLPIHDSFRVQERHADTLRDAMRTCAEHVCGIALQVK